VLVAVLARGHVLLEGPPGLGKTLLVRTLGEVLGCETKRIQFTPDLMPSDVTGGNVWSQARSNFEFLAGPVFTQLLLGDEINRAPAKTQSALLEAMQERSVTVDGATRSLPEPFLVIATQNPIESQGTYPLPEAQLDRFLFKLEVRAPGRAVEKAILTNHLQGFDATALGRLGAAAADHRGGIVAAAAAGATGAGGRQLARLHHRDRRSNARAPGHLLRGVTRGRRSRCCWARRRWRPVEGRAFAIPDDVKALAPAVLRHRVGLQPDAEIEGVTPDDCVAEILREVRVPATAAA
jgi:MoxR-like ATPase